MGATTISDVTDQIQTVWSEIFMQELREQFILANLVSREYEGEIKTKGDTVKISQIDAPQNTKIRTVGTDADTFQTSTLSTRSVSITADKRAVEAYEFSDLVEIQSIVDPRNNPDIRRTMVWSIGKQINDYLYSLVSPSTTAPDHDITSTTALNSAVLLAGNTLAAEAKWLEQNGWWVLASPQYYEDVLGDTTLTSSDFTNDDFPVLNGRIGQTRYGWNVIRDNSRTGLYGIGFMPGFMQLVQQTQPTFKISDLHSNKEFGYVMSVDVVFGAKLSIDGGEKHIRWTN